MKLHILNDLHILLGTRVACNSRGCVRQALAPGFRPELVVGMNLHGMWMCARVVEFLVD